MTEDGFVEIAEFFVKEVVRSLFDFAVSILCHLRCPVSNGDGEGVDAVILHERAFVPCEA